MSETGDASDSVDLCSIRVYPTHILPCPFCSSSCPTCLFVTDSFAAVASPLGSNFEFFLCGNGAFK